MDRESAREELRKHLSEYLRTFHPEVRDIRRPFRCLNPEHKDENPSMSFDEKHKRVHCFSCGASYDIIDLIMLDNKFSSYAEAFKHGYELYGIDVEHRFVVNNSVSLTQSRVELDEEPVIELGKYFEQCRARIDETDYPQKRGLSEDIVKHFGLGYDPGFNYGAWQALIIPTGNSSYVARNVDPNAAEDRRIRKFGHSVVYNIDVLGEKRSVFITEGEIDCLSVIEAGGVALALGSVANIGRFLDYLDSHKELWPERPFLISLDNDESGEKAARKLMVELGKRGVRFRKVNISGSFKDPNEALLADRIAFISAVQDAESFEEDELRQEREDYLSRSVAGSMSLFLDEVEHNSRVSLMSTGFGRLDDVLDGGLYEGLYFIGAISSLGKTCFMHQISDNVARGGHDVLSIALEMSKSELMARSISRETFQLVASGACSGTAKTTREILSRRSRGVSGQGYNPFNEADLRIVSQAQSVYSSYGEHIFIIEGVGSIGVTQVREAVERHIRLTGRVPVVFVDYLQLLAPDNPRMTDKQAVDHAVLELKRISRDFRTPVVVISSFNRESYKNRVTMAAFKESGGIEFCSDVLIGLQLEGVEGKDFDVDVAKQQNPRKVEAVILKNRNGPTGDKILLSFYAKYNYFAEK